MAAQDFAVKHPRQHDVVGKLGLTGALRSSVNFAKWLPDNFQIRPVFFLLRHSVVYSEP
jgi:hypothetical protein